MTPAPEQLAREKIDAALASAGWVVQDRKELNLSAGIGVAVREVPLAPGHGRADYLLFVDGQAVGALEAKPENFHVGGVEPQAKKYAEGLPANLPAPVRPLPFLYISNGAVTSFTNLLDPHPRSREIFHVHQPETLSEWLQADTLDSWTRTGGFYTAADDTRPSTLRSRLSALPPLIRGRLFANQVQAIENLEHSFKQDRPRALIQMATGSGKTLMAISSIYRLIKFGGARRVLFLVDRSNLGEQAELEFGNFRSPDDNRKFTELYKVQRLSSNKVGDSSKVVITTIQRLYSMLKGEAEMDPSLEEGSTYESAAALFKEPLPVAYNKEIPPEFFDVVVVDECHRSIYTLWRQVLEYFDGYIVGLTATPGKHTLGFFKQNLVMEYGHEQAVADGVNVDFEVYRIRTRITAEGSVAEVDDHSRLKVRDRRSRAVRWEKADEDVKYGPNDVDRSVVSESQIRLIIRTFRDRVLPEAFPGRRDVPKTLIFAKDDNHAEDIVGIVREEFGKGNDLCQKITYKVTGVTPRQLIQDFRTGYFPRVAVTVDLVATGTDIRPIEVVMFMRAVKSRVLFEQMKGRGVRVIDKDELKAVTPDAQAKTHFLIVDCVEITDSDLEDTQPIERKKTVPMKALLEHVAMGGTDSAVLSSLQSRLSRLDQRCEDKHRARIAAVSGGATLRGMAKAIEGALDPDRQLDAARLTFGIPTDQEPTPAQVKKVAQAMATQAVQPLATRPELRATILALLAEFDQIMDETSKDSLEEDKTGLSVEAREKARTLVDSFQQYVQENPDEIAALEFFYSVPHRIGLRFGDIKELAQRIQAPPRSWTPEELWHAYELLDRDKVRGASGQRLLTDVVSLVRYALEQEDELVPFGDLVRERFENWMAQQANHGRKFTDQQVVWLEMIRDHLATSLEVSTEDFDYEPFAQEGGLARARRVFGKELEKVIEELREELVA